MSLNERTPDEQDALEELVHDQASQIASDAINAGDEVEFLLSHGWTLDQIEQRLSEATAAPNT